MLLFLPIRKEGIYKSQGYSMVGSNLSAQDMLVGRCGLPPAPLNILGVDLKMCGGPQGAS